ncbi:aldo/keto reductase [Bacteroidota bacterium]
MAKLKMNKTGYDRREFIKMSASLAALMSMPACFRSAQTDKWGTVLPTRTLGSTELEATIFCVGGGPIPVPTGEEAGRIIEHAIQGGCRFFETARRYADGQSEEAWGKYLIPTYRNEIILMSKSPAGKAEDMNRDIDASLEAFKTDYIDIYLMHGIGSPDDVERRFTGGAFDALVRAKEEGKINHIGFSGHKDPEAHNYLINKNLPDLEVVILPLNAIDPLRNSFVLNTIPVALKHNMGIIAMKVFGGGSFIGENIVWGYDEVGKSRERIMPDLISSAEAQHFSISLPIASTSIGCTVADHVDEAIANARSFTGMSETERKSLTERLSEVALNYNFEHYKALGS